MSFERFTFAADLHGDRQDVSVVDAFFRFDAMWKPKLRIFGGDLVDLRPLRKGANQEERCESMRSDVDAGQAFLKRWKPTAFLRGNHDERLWDLARSACDGIAADYARQGCEAFETACKLIKCEMLPYHKSRGVLRIGHLKLLHGFFAGVNAARQTALVYGSSLFAHVHTIDEHSIPGIERRVARSVGALCQLDMDYNFRQPSSLRHANGWGYGVVNRDSGEYHVWQAERISGKWMLPSDVVTIG